MKILFVTNMYPTESNPVFGIFVKEQIMDIVSAIDCEHHIYYIHAKKRSKLMYLVSLFRIPVMAIFGKYNIIHIHYGISALFLLFYKSKAKVFLTLHGGDILQRQDNRWQIFLTKRIVLKADKVFILNNEMEAIMRSLNVDYQIIPCGVNTKFFKCNHAKNPDVKLILFPADPSVKVKNFKLFQQVIDELVEKSPYRIECQCVCNLSREGVRDLLNTADCLLMTSFSEGSPQVVKEAICCGVPVVSVPVGDVKEMTDSVPHCYVSDSYLPEELARLVLLSFQADGPSIREAFIIKNIYDSDSVASRIIQNYTDAKKVSG